jgi:small RNA 2'-O-methyltransferase
MASELHEERLDTVVRYLLESGAARVLDLGCASGDLLLRLAGQPQFTRIVGIDVDEGALAEARAALMLDASPHP